MQREMSESLATSYERHRQEKEPNENKHKAAQKTSQTVNSLVISHIGGG